VYKTRRETTPAAPRVPRSSDSQSAFQSRAQQIRRDACLYATSPLLMKKKMDEFNKKIKSKLNKILKM
jgi:hypothetical protein